MADDLDIRAKLTLDDESADALRQVKKGHEDVGKAAEGTEKKVGFLQHTMANFAAIQLSGITTQLRGIFHGFVDAASEGQQADQAIAALISGVQQIPWDDAHEGAEQLGDDLDMVALKTHQLGQDVNAAFTTMVEIYGASEAGLTRARDDVETLAGLANVLGQSTESIAGQFAMMGEGVVKTKSQLFQLLQPTGIFGDKIKEASKNWASLTEEQRIERLSYGIGQLTSEMGKANPTFNDMLKTASNIWDITSEKLGEPLIHALVPEMQKFAKELEDGLPAIEEFGRAMAVDVKAWVGEAAASIQDGFEYIKDHGTEIRESIGEGVEMLRSAVGFILEHKEALAYAFGAKAGIGLIKGAAESGFGGQAIGGAKALYGAGASGAGILGGAGGMLGGVAALTAGAAALVSLGLAAQQLVSLMGELPDVAQESDAIKDGMRRMALDADSWSGDNIAAFERMRENLIRATIAMDGDVDAANKYANAMEQQISAHVKNMAAMESFADMASQLEDEQKVVDLMMSGQLRDKSDPGGEGAMASLLQHSEEASAAFAEAFSNAMATQDQGSQLYIGKLLGGSKALSSAFLASAQLTDEGWKALADSIAAGGEEFSGLAQLFRDRAGGDAAAMDKKFKPVMNFSGSTFKIQQDFRDQDPDRIALVFKEDLVKAASSRLQATTGIG